MVLADRTPPGSQRSTWVERGHARRLGRRESASAYWFCPSCGRALYAIKKASGFPHGSSVDSCGNRLVFGWLCRTRLGEVQNRPSATSPIPKGLQCGSAELEMALPILRSGKCRSRPQKAHDQLGVRLRPSSPQTGHSETVRDSSESRAQSARIT